MNPFQTVSIAMGASFCAGINLYATVATLGLMHRYVDGFQLPNELAVLGSHWVIWPALFMYVCEFIADKIPGVDHVWDAIHTFIRVPAGAFLAAKAFGNIPPGAEMTAMILGGGLALSSHGAKATLRYALNTEHTGVPAVVATPLVSILEDLVVVLAMFFFKFGAILSFVFVTLLIAGTIFILVIMWAVAVQLFRDIFRSRDEGYGEAMAKATERARRRGRKEPVPEHDDEAPDGGRASPDPASSHAKPPAAGA
jgi:hypothetical protein